ncbi:MAG: hypothetical protein WBL28_03370 [Methylotenera sp.]
MRNLQSAGKGIIISTGNTAAKGAEKTAKWMATDHTGGIEDIKLMQSQQRVSSLLARSLLDIRTVERSNDRVGRLIDTGVEASNSEVISGWMVDHMLYLLDLLWGFIGPILSYLLFSLLSVFLVILFNVIFFGALYLYFTS